MLFRSGHVFEGRSNGSQATATPLPLSEVLSGLLIGRGIGSLDPGGDSDFWSVSLRAGDRLEIATETSVGWVRLYNAAGQELAVDNNSGPDSQDYISGYTVPADGTYSIQVGSDYGIDNYTLRVMVARGMDLEYDREYANNQISTANGLSWTQQGNLRQATVAGTIMARQGGTTDVDTYALGVLNAGNTVTLGIRVPTGSTLAPLVQVVNSAGVAVADTDPTDAGFSGSITASDSYYAVVSNAYFVRNGWRYATPQIGRAHV